MTVSFGVGTNYLTFTAGSSAAMGSGAFSMFALVNFGAGNNNGGVWGGYNSTTAVRAFGEASNALFGLNDFSAGVGPITQATWYIVGITKTVGAAMFRMHFRAQGAGAWTHAIGSGASNQSDGASLTTHRIGFSAVFGGNVDVAWAGLWTSALADASIDTCGTSALQDFANLSPQDLIEFSGWNGTSGHTVPIGTTTLSGATGANSVGTNPTYNFTVSGSAPPDVAPVSRALPMPILLEVAARWRTAQQADTVTAYAASGSGTALAHPATAATTTKATTGASTAATRATTSATGVKGAANTAGALAHPSTVDTAQKQTTGTGAAVAHPSTTAASLKKALGVGAPLAHPSTGAASVKQAAGAGAVVAHVTTTALKVTAVTTGTASAHVATTATGGKVAAASATASAHVATAGAATKQATGAGTPSARATTAGATVKRVVGAGTAPARAATAGAGVKRSLAAAVASARPLTVSAAARQATGAALAVTRSTSVAVFVPPDAEPPPEPDAVHVSPAPLAHVTPPMLAHVTAAPLVHVGQSP